MRMTHYVKTSAGVSKGNIKHENSEDDAMNVTQYDDYTTRSGNIGGVGQGGGASPIEWLGLLIRLMHAFKAFSDGAKLVNPEGLFGGIISSHKLC